MKSLSRLKFTVAVIAGTFFASPVVSAEEFRNTISGEDLKVLETAAPEGRDTEAVKRFLETGVNAYTEVKACLPKGEEVYLHLVLGLSWSRQRRQGRPRPQRRILDVSEEQDRQGLVRNDLRRRARNDGPA